MLKKPIAIAGLRNGPVKIQYEHSLKTIIPINDICGRFMYFVIVNLLDLIIQYHELLQVQYIIEGKITRPVTLDILRFWHVVSFVYLSGALATLGCSIF